MMAIEWIVEGPSSYKHIDADYVLFKHAGIRLVGFPWQTFFELAQSATVTGALRAHRQHHLIVTRDSTDTVFRSVPLVFRLWEKSHARNSSGRSGEKLCAFEWYVFQRFLCNAACWSLQFRMVWRCIKLEFATPMPINTGGFRSGLPRNCL